MSKLLSVIIPAYNESKTILDILQKVTGLDIPGIDLEIIVIDDCSTDDTKTLGREIHYRNIPGRNIKLLNQEKNQGKGAAIHLGIRRQAGIT